MSKKIRVLENNRLLSIKDYIQTFTVSRPTASKMFNADKRELQLRTITAAKFFSLYGSFPVKFKPRFMLIEVTT